MDAKIDPALEQQFDLNLIEAVKMNPVIYDRSHFNYKHFVRKAQTWKQIAESLGVPEQKCTKRWKSLRDKFARELKISQDSRWRYFKQMSFLMESIRQYRESLLGKVSSAGIPANTTNTVTAQVEAPQQTHQHQQSQQQVVDLFTTPFNGSATITTQSLTGHPHAILVTGDAAQLAAANNAVKDQKTYYYEPVMKRERIVEDDQQQQQQQQQQQAAAQQQQQHHSDMLSSIKIFQNSISQNVSAEDQSFGVVVTDMLNTLGVRQKAEAKVHIIKYLTDMQLLAQHNKY